MVGNEIGATESQGNYEIREVFWDAFERPERDEVIPSREVPLANSFETLRLFLTAIAETDGSKREIDGQVAEFEARHADLYGTAGWLLGFVHEDAPTEATEQEVRRWGLTKRGVEYLRLRQQGDTERARRRLAEAVRQVEVVERILAELEAEGELPYDRLAERIAAETTLSESSASRRASPVSQWLTALPEVETKPDGRTKTFVLV
ncbi:MAG: hypothetical protein ABEJ79_05565 [Halolamina sp.]